MFCGSQITAPVLNLRKLEKKDHGFSMPEGMPSVFTLLVSIINKCLCP